MVAVVKMLYVRQALVRRGLGNCLRISKTVKINHKQRGIRVWISKKDGNSRLEIAVRLAQCALCDIMINA